jgi:hypothetical protein
MVAAKAYARVDHAARRTAQGMPGAEFVRD